jgi:predicted  nucleic acid-binding Zn ribbon protein
MVSRPSACAAAIAAFRSGATHLTPPIPVARLTSRSSTTSGAVRHWARDWEACDTHRSPYGFAKLTSHMEAIIGAADAPEADGRLPDGYIDQQRWIGELPKAKVNSI